MGPFGWHDGSDDDGGHSGEDDEGEGQEERGSQVRTDHRCFASSRCKSHCQTTERHKVCLCHGLLCWVGGVLLSAVACVLMAAAGVKGASRLSS